MIRLEVHGAPAPKGSVQAFVRGGRAQIVTGGAKSTRAHMKAWDAAVRQAACDARSPTGASFDGPSWVKTPIEIAIAFRMARPAGHWSANPKKPGLKASAPMVPIVKPDIDKLVRTTLDAMTGILFDDDSAVVELNVSKMYAAPGTEGATILIRPWRPE